MLSLICFSSAKKRLRLSGGYPKVKRELFISSLVMPSGAVIMASIIKYWRLFIDCFGAESYVFHAKVSDYVVSKQGKVVLKIKGHP